MLLAYFELAQEVVWERIIRRMIGLAGTGPEGLLLARNARTCRLEAEGFEQAAGAAAGAYNAMLTEAIVTLPGKLTHRVEGLRLVGARHSQAYLNKPAPLGEDKLSPKVTRTMRFKSRRLDPFCSRRLKSADLQSLIINEFRRNDRFVHLVFSELQTVPTELISTFWLSIR